LSIILSAFSVTRKGALVAQIFQLNASSEQQRPRRYQENSSRCAWWGENVDHGGVRYPGCGERMLVLVLTMSVATHQKIKIQIPLFSKNSSKCTVTKSSEKGFSPVDSMSGVLKEVLPKVCETHSRQHGHMQFQRARRFSCGPAALPLCTLGWKIVTWSGFRRLAWFTAKRAASLRFSASPS
jgi:hypothetical protein